MRFSIAVVILTMGLGLVTRAGADPKTYSLADLRALAKQQAWLELVDHLDDVAPSGRDADWRSLVQQAGLGVLTMAGSGGPADGLAVGELLLARYPALAQSKDYMTKRAELGYAALEHCYDKRSWASTCTKRLRAFAAADPSNRELAFKLGKLVPAFADRAQAAPVFALALHTKDDARCKDADVRIAVVAGLGVDASSDPDLVSAAVQLASGTCAAALRDAVQTALGSDSKYILHNACPFMRSQLAAGSLLAKRCDNATKAP